MTQIGIIGGGNISETHARAAGEIGGAEVAAVWGPNREKTARLAQLYGGTVYDSLPSFLEHKQMDLRF